MHHQNAMTMKRNSILFPFVLMVLTGTVYQFSACVPARKLEDSQRSNMRLQDSVNTYRNDLNELSARVKTMDERIDGLEKDNRTLKKDTTEYGIRYRNIDKMNQRLNELYEKVIAQNKALLENTSSEKEKLMAELNEKEKELNDKEMELTTKENELKATEDRINALNESLQQREARVKELEQAMNAKDSVVNALREKVNEALLGFSDNDLTVEIRNGKVYVSLAEKLLFKSGSTLVDPKGKEALAKLAAVLKKNTDIDIIIEGHTDNVPLRPSDRMKDNWDLSVLRATSIVRILTGNGVEPARISASGRGEFHPVDSNETSEGKARNRRTEIILSPKLDELFNLLEDQESLNH